MKFGVRKPSLKKMFKARTTGRAKRALKKAINPMYGQKGTGVLHPKKAVYNKVYSNTSVGVGDIVKNCSSNAEEFQVKKFLCILLSTLLLIALVSCGSSKEGEMLSSEDEFGVYENGQQVISALDLKAQYEDDGVFTFSRQGKEDFPGRTLETERGIK